MRELVDAGPPGYVPPPDPWAVVAARVQARRRRRRVVQVASVAAAVVVAVGAPRLVTVDDSVTPVAAPPPAPGMVQIEPGDSGWLVSSSTRAGRVYATTTHRSDECLFAPRAGRTLVCFAVMPSVDWVGVHPDQWGARARTVLMGVTNRDAVGVLITLSDGTRLRSPTASAPTTSRVRFFVTDLPAGRRFASVQAVDRDGRALGPAAAPPARPA